MSNPFMNETNTSDYSQTLGSNEKVASAPVVRAQEASKVVAIRTRFESYVNDVNVFRRRGDYEFFLHE